MSIEVMNAVWRHSASTGRARLVLLAIADHQGEIGAWPSIATLARMVNASERSVQRDVQFLEQIGELKVESQAAPTRSQYKSNLYWVQLPGVTNEESGATDSQSGVTETSIRGDAVVAQNLNKPLLKPNKNTVRDELERVFNEFWSIYPRRSGKGLAKKALEKALTSASADEILEGARRYASDPNRSPSFTAMPATWLNQERWDDEPLPERVLSPEERKMKDEADRKARLEREAEQRRLNEIRFAEERAKAEKLRAELAENPIEQCKHGRIIYACSKCYKKALGNTAAN